MDGKDIEGRVDRMQAQIRNDFPILEQKINNNPLIYFDNGATIQMPNCVLECLNRHYMQDNANVHRGIHTLSERSTCAMEDARKTVADFIGCDDPMQIIFTRGATDSLNQVAFGYAAQYMQKGRKVIVTEFEHHSNFVPWQQAAKRTGAEFVVIPMREDGRLDIEALERELDESVVIVSVTAISNVTGTVLPVREIIQKAHQYNVPVCVDASQAIRHGQMNVRELDCDFLAFSGHKTMGPAGIGVLYGKKERLDVMEPLWYGGGMVDVVGNEDTSFTTIPYRLEAGTPNYPGAIGLGQALHYLQEIGTKEIAAWEKELTDTLEQRLSEQKYVHVLGGNVEKQSVISVVVDGIHPYDMASFLNKYGIAVRSGNHCAQPMLRRLGYDSVIRFSPAFYNTKEEIEVIGDRMEKIISFLKKW